MSKFDKIMGGVILGSMVFALMVLSYVVYKEFTKANKEELACADMASVFRTNYSYNSLGCILNNQGTPINISK